MSNVQKMPFAFRKCSGGQEGRSLSRVPMAATLIRPREGGPANASSINGPATTAFKQNGSVLRCSTQPYLSSPDEGPPAPVR